jgi:hypothetical protein
LLQEEFTASNWMVFYHLITGPFFNCLLS